MSLQWQNIVFVFHSHKNVSVVILHFDRIFVYLSIQHLKFHQELFHNITILSIKTYTRDKIQWEEKPIYFCLHCDQKAFLHTGGVIHDLLRHKSDFTIFCMNITWDIIYICFALIFRTMGNYSRFQNVISFRNVIKANDSKKFHTWISIHWATRFFLETSKSYETSETLSWNICCLQNISRLKCIDSPSKGVLHPLSYPKNTEKIAFRVQGVRV